MRAVNLFTIASIVEMFDSMENYRGEHFPLLYTIYEGQM